LGAAYQRLFF